MDFDNVKAEKAKALRRYNRFRRIGRFFRAAEFCVAILFISWTFTRLPFAVQISREFLRRIAGVISTPLFVFLLGNCIVVLLLTKSSHDQTTGAAASEETEFYQAFVRSVEDRSDEDLAAQEIVYDDKQVIVTHLISNPNPNLVAGDENIPHQENDHIEIDLFDCVADQHKVYRRSKSAKQSPDYHMVMKPSLQRSETSTEKCRKIDDEWKIMKEDSNNYPEDNLSNEEFQKTIEAFIAKQLMFRRQESLAVVVVHNKA